MSLKVLLRNVVSISLPFIFVSVEAESPKSGVEVGLGYVYSDARSDILDDSNGWLGQVGYRFDSNWGAEIAYNDISYDVQSDFVSGSLDRKTFMVNGLYHVDNSHAFDFYFSAGIGYYDLGSFNRNGLNIGAGFKFFPNDNIVLRPEVRHHQTDGSNNKYTDLTITFSLFFGKK